MISQAVLLLLSVGGLVAQDAGYSKNQGVMIPHRRRLAAQVAFPVQTFFIPLPEESMFKDMFYQINPEKARPGVVTMLSLAIATDETIIWYDHWEDGYDADVSNRTSPTTEVWGDGIAANGCAPDVQPCTDASDSLMAGRTVVIQNTVSLPRNRAVFAYDGADRVQASFPIAITRGAYPVAPGSLMAGAVEVLEVKSWGYTFEAPLGMDIGKYFEAFQFSAFFYMAAYDDTVITLPDGKTLFLNQGESGVVRVNQRDRLVSSKLLQVDLITGDVWSYYELRWFSLIGVEDWHNQYVSPVGDSVGKTKVLLYNPNPTNIDVSIDYLEGGTTKKTVVTSVSSQRAVLSHVIPTNSGAWFNSTGKFIALSLTDTEFTTSTGQKTGSQWYDWGFPVMPRTLLTSQVLIGWGYGCTDNKCYGQEDRSVVWLTAVEDADVFVDYNNVGRDYLTYQVNALQSIKIKDGSDQDMSGAVIFATEKGSGPDGRPIDIAAAWGQDPSVSEQYQSISLDLGTVVVPFTLVRVTKKVDKKVVKPGDTLTYTIRINNVGNKVLKAGSMTLYDQLDEHATYIEDSSVSGLTGTLIHLPDDPQAATAFPLDENGHLMTVSIERRGGSYDIEFKAVIDGYESLTTGKIENAGRLVTDSGTVYAYQAESMVDFGAKIDIINTVYLGHDQGASCGTGKDVEKVQGDFGAAVTYCLLVTNVGTAKLGNVQVVDEILQYINTGLGNMNPGDSVMLTVEKSITGTITNIATATGNPLFFDGTDIPEHADVSDSDPSAVDKIDHSPNIQVENTVYIGDDNGAQCSTNVPKEKAYGVVGADVIYCFVVTNIGDTHLNSISLSNDDLAFTDNSIGHLSPGQKGIISYQTTLSSNLVNTVVVRGNPVTSDGTDLMGVDDVTDTDPSEVVQNLANPAIEISNRVYLGDDRGAKCDTDKPVEKVESYRTNSVVYCFEITNTGDTYLSNVRVNDDELNFSNDSSIKLLAPGQSTILAVWMKITGDILNHATVTANPSTSTGTDMVGYDDVSDVDPSEVVMITHGAEIDVQNTVYIGHDDGNSCGTAKAKEREAGFIGTQVTYCFEVTNTGQTHLKDVALDDLQLTFQDGSIGMLAPGASATIFHQTSIDQPLVNTANATAMPSDENGGNLVGATEVTDSDPSEVAKLENVPSIEVLNTVYAGADGGESCNTDAPVEEVTDYSGTPVVYCFRIANRGDVHLKDIRISNPELSFEDTGSVSSLAPGEFVFISVAGIISKTFPNTVSVTANPVTETGDDVPGVPDVTDSDPSSVVLKDVVAGVSIENTVYAGHNGGQSCGTTIPSELVQGYSGANVTYCFRLRNTGETHLTGISLLDGDLIFEDDSLDVLAPNATAIVSFQSKITKALINTATVTAQPARSTGDAIVGSSEVHDDDPSAVEVTQINPGVTISNTVYVGQHDNGASCGGTLAAEKVSGYQGDQVTYCFKIVNTGDVYLGSITIDNTELSFVDNSLGLLAPKASVTVPLQTTLSSSHVNTAFVTASPATPQGNEILGADSVQASDPSEVEKLEHQAGVSVVNTVYLGHDGGTSCDDSTDKTAEGFAGTKVTYCFKITNTGKTYLGDITIDNVDLEYYNDGEAIGPIAPGNSTTIAVSKFITNDLENIARVKANPVSVEGKDLQGTDHVTDNDQSSVSKKIHNPSIEIENKVYLGTNGGSSCDQAADKVTGYQGDYVTYCFVVKNTGNTHLNSITVHNSHLSFTDLSVGLLSPGESALVIYAGLIHGDDRNVVQVAANPVTPTEDDIIGGEDVSDSDPSEVAAIDANPRITIKNKVYKGDDDGAQCGTDVAAENAEGYFADVVVYCLTIQNTGDTYLTDVVINDIGLDFYDDSTISTLAPTESVTIVVTSSIEETLENTADVTANPVTPEGVEIIGVDDVTDSDSSSVQKLEHDATILIQNNVYVGHNGGKSCDTEAATSRAAGFEGEDVTYCFKVTNTGATHLGVVTVDNRVLNFYDSSIGSLAPGESATVFFESDITGDLQNIAVATANPIASDGSDLLGTDNVEDKDVSEVGLLQDSASITIVNTVYNGHDDGELCNTDAAVDVLETYARDDVTYCLVVTNSGNTHLSRVIVADPSLSFRDSTTIGLMAPGDKVSIHVARTADKELKNTAMVTANPVTSKGVDIVGAEEVTSSDPSTVTLLQANPKISISNKVYLGEDEGNSCGTTLPQEKVVSYSGDAVVFCMTVTNTGDTYLDDITITNAELDYYDDYSVGMLAPGESSVVPIASTIDGNVLNVANIVATAVSPSGLPIRDLNEVTDTDPSEIGEFQYDASIFIENKVYAGDDGGNSCITDVPSERVTSFSGSVVTYCFKVTNTGKTFLNHIQITNPALSFTDATMPMLPPGSSEIVSTTGIITGDLENTATVTANPVSNKGDDLQGADDVTHSDPSEVAELSRAPRLTVSNTAYHGHDNGSSCPGTEKVIGMLGDRVTYCFEVKNTGNLPLANVELRNTELSFVDTSTIDLLQPGQSVTIHVQDHLQFDLTNTANAQGRPTDKDGVPLAGAGVVMDSDPSEVSVYTGDLSASVNIENTVYVGEDFGAQCNTASELAQGENNDEIVYCYAVKNTGQTYLSKILIAADASEYPDNSIGILAPGEVQVVKFVSKVDGNFTNVATVTARPVRGDGTAIPDMDAVTDADPSQVEEIIDGDTRFGDKTPYKPPTDPGKCMQENYDLTGKDEDLICTAKEVQLESLESDIGSCTLGSEIKMDIIATIRVDSPRYDVGWYIATDGGDSLTGTCAVNGFQEGSNLSVVKGPNSDQTAGYVSWKDDVNGPADSCGDVIMAPGDTGYIELPIVVDTPITCMDADDDGILDFSICFSWRTDTTDAECNVADGKTVVPGASDACYCTRYNLPSVTVDDGPAVEPCR